MLLAELPFGENQDPQVFALNHTLCCLENQGAITGNVEAFSHMFRSR